MRRRHVIRLRAWRYAGYDGVSWGLAQVIGLEIGTYLWAPSAIAVWNGCLALGVVVGDPARRHRAPRGAGGSAAPAPS